jgi:FkbM family methyltransferase
MIAEPGIHVLPSVSGLQLAIDIDDYASCMMFYGRYSAELITLTKSVVQRGSSVLDIGAQLGYMTAHLAELVGPTGCVHSFEPDPKALALLRRTVKANEHSWVKIFPFVVGDMEGEIDFNLSPTLGWSTAVKGTHLRDLSTIRARATTIDRLSADGELRRPVSFIKIDVEGFECQVLDGMRELVKCDRPLILAEVNPLLLKPLGRSSIDLLERLARHDYRLLRIAEADGLLRGGGVRLMPTLRRTALEFCDVLAVPAEAHIPPNLCPDK